MRTSAQRRSLRVVTNESVETRLRAAFPEIDLNDLATKTPTLNAYNVGEKWAFTVRTVEFWVDLANRYNN